MFAKVLKSLRNDHNLTQKELAEKLNVSTSTIGMYESGKRDPDITTLNRIAVFFNVSTDYLLGNSTKMNEYSASQKNTDLEQLDEEFPEGVKVLMRAKEELTPAQKRVMIKLMKTFMDEVDSEE